MSFIVFSLEYLYPKFLLLRPVAPGGFRGFQTPLTNFQTEEQFTMVQLCMKNLFLISTPSVTVVSEKNDATSLLTQVALTYQT